MTLSGQTDNTAEQLIVSFRNGEEDGFNYFFKLYYKSLCFFAKRYVKDMASAEDIVSDGFLQLWANREKIESESHIRNWLYRAVYHLCLDQLAKNKTRERHDRLLKHSNEKEEKDCSINIAKAETLRQLREAIDLLPGQCKKIFYKLYVEGKTVRETAEELHLAISTIDNQKARGIKLLREKLGPSLGVLAATILFI